MINICYIIPSTTKNQHKAAYSRKYYDEETLKLIQILKVKSQEYEEKGDLKNALDTLDTIIAWNPADYEMQAKYKELAGRLKKEEAAQHLAKANSYFKDGNYTDAVL